MLDWAEAPIAMKHRLSRRQYLAATGFVTAGSIGMAGCSGGSTGTLATQVSDQPRDISDFSECVVTIVGMWLGPEAATPGTQTGDEPSRREYYEYDSPQQADLVDLQGDAAALVDERELDTATYDFLQLDIDGIDAVLDDGSEATVEVPGAAPLTFNKSFEIRANTRTVFTADFTAVKRGQAGGYILQPVPSELQVEYEDSG